MSNQQGQGWEEGNKGLILVIREDGRLSNHECEGEEAKVWETGGTKTKEAERLTSKILKLEETKRLVTTLMGTMSATMHKGQYKTHDKHGDGTSRRRDRRACSKYSERHERKYHGKKQDKLAWTSWRHIRLLSVGNGEKIRTRNKERDAGS